MTHEEAAKFYDQCDDSLRRYYGVLGVLFFHYEMPKLIEYLRGILHEKNN